VIALRRLSLDILAILAGFVADTASTMAVSTAIVSAMASAGISDSEILGRMHGISGLLLSLIYGLGCTVLGGFVAGHIAKRQETAHGAIVGGASLLLGLFLREGGLPLWFEIASYLLIVPAGAYGGSIAERRRHKAKRKGD
jgi:hypothetical protein